MATTPRPAASAPNTGTFPYLDTKEKKKFCDEEEKAIIKNCGPEDEEKKKERLKKQKGGVNALLSKLKLPQKKEKVRKGNANWINDHCEFLMLKPSDPQGLLNELESLPKNLAESLGKAALEKTIEAAKQKVEREIEERVAKIMLKKGAQKVAGRALSLLTGPFAIAINVAMTAYDVYDAAQTYKEVAAEFESKFKEIKQTADKLADVNKQIAEVQDALNSDRYRNDDGSFSPTKMVSDVMYAAAEMNDCIRARRCSLVKFKDAEKMDGGGCCPGQTGHHVLPSAMFDGCVSYKEKEAPVICTEGTSNWAGSHKAVHENLRDILIDLKDPRTGKVIPKGAPISKEQAIKSGTESVRNTFKGSLCSEDCIKEQLKKFYDKLNCQPKNESGFSGKSTSQGQGGNTNR